MDVCLLYLLRFTDGGLCDRQITRPVASYRVCVCVSLCDHVQKQPSAPAMGQVEVKLPRYRTGPWGSWRLRLLEFLDNRHMKVVRLSAPTHRPSLPTRKIPGTHFCYRLSRPQSHNATGRIKSLKNSSDSMGNRTRDLPVCSAVPQPTAPPRTPTGTRASTTNDTASFNSEIYQRCSNASRLACYGRGTFLQALDILISEKYCHAICQQ